ncbi:T9SS type A sorting domain-containing protein [Flavobacterium terrigena]|uniref:Por secretion system C-terminal sorting domain-containing protein n=1 Tax=Flavobacterium terrigena TaxID=402734 RepID=A0A1H6UDN8_9FLAO|nr:T9SS type A sorting domain-containing protein [Flavobacterium terrigena]SEI88764.1 Por secretion system C-terminal sorting domain-containing protein [Flavobacterium terrigena]
MKKYIFLLILVTSFLNGQNITFSDVNFKNALINTNCVDIDNNGTGESDADTDNDNEIQLSEALAVTRLLVFGQNISNLSGIENFTNLQKLDCTNNNLTFINFQNNNIITTLFCDNNQITNLVLNNLPNLTNFSCSSNLIQSLDLSTTGFVQGNFGNNPNLQLINLKNNVLNMCIVFPFTGSDYTCVMFLGCPALQLVCLDDNENMGYFSGPPQQNVQFSTSSNCTLSSESFSNNQVTLFPNPVKNELNFSFEKTVSIKEINIYNTLGQLVKQFNKPQNSIHLSDLNTGYYHIEFISEEGKLTKKFIKE